MFETDQGTNTVGSGDMGDVIRGKWRGRRTHDMIGSRAEWATGGTSKTRGREEPESIGKIAARVIARIRRE